MSEENGIIITKTEWEKCPRCWRHEPTCGQFTKYKHRAWKELCYRCADVIEGMYKSGELAARDNTLQEYRVSQMTWQEKVSKCVSKIKSIIVFWK